MAGMKGYISPVEARERGHENHMYPADCSRCGMVTLHECKDGRAWCRACGLHDQNDLALAWAAGFLDGEGCFTFTKMSGATHSSQRGLHIGASQVRDMPIIKLQEIFDGTVGTSRQTRDGSIIHWWRVGSANAVREIVPLLLPYLTVKKREAEILLEFSTTVRRRGHHLRGVGSTTDEEVAIRMKLIEELEGIRRGSDR